MIKQKGSICIALFFFLLGGMFGFIGCSHNIPVEKETREDGGITEITVIDGASIDNNEVMDQQAYKEDEGNEQQIYEDDEEIDKQTYELVVNSGTGGGAYVTGSQVTIMANAPPAGQVFVAWIGDFHLLANPANARQTFTMPAQDLTFTATYGLATAKYKVTVNSGTGGGSYLPGSQVMIEANTPPAGKLFAAWSGDIAVLADPANAQQTFTMPPRDLTFTATYGSATVEYKVTVNNGTGSGSYLPKSKVTIKANAPPAGKVFAAWTGNIGVLADSTDAEQTFTMPTRELIFTATYKDVAQTINPCQNALCWQNAPSLNANCGQNYNSEDFSSGKYNVHRYPFTTPKNVTVELTLARTAGIFEPAIIIHNTTGVTLYDGIKASSGTQLTITALNSGQGANIAKVRLKASATIQLYVFITSWATIYGKFSTTIPKTVKYTLTVFADCPAAQALCPMNKSSITHFGSGFFTSSDSSDPNSPNYNPYKRDSRTSHSGYDLHAPMDVPVVATQDGKIIASNPDNIGDCGRSINLAANSGVTFRYCHLNKVLVTSGPVTAGQLIGYNGKTGNANSPHIHFVYLDAPNVTNSGTTFQRSSKVNKYIDTLCR